MYLCLLMYDIKNAYSLQKVAKRCIKEGMTRLQRSIFIGLMRKKEVQDLQVWLQNLLVKEDEQIGQVAIIMLRPHQLKEVINIGTSLYDIEQVLGEKHTLIY